MICSQNPPGEGGQIQQHALGPVYGKKMRHGWVVEPAPGPRWGAWLRIHLGKGGGSRTWLRSAPVQGAGRGGLPQQARSSTFRCGGGDRKYTESRKFCDSVTRIWPFLIRQ